MKKRNKSVSFDAMVKFFMQYYNIATKKDVATLLKRIDDIEAILQSIYGDKIGKNIRKKTSLGKTATGKVLEIIKQSETGMSFADIRKKYGQAIRIVTFHDEEWTIIESRSAEVKVAEVLKEYEIRTYEEMIRDAEAARVRALG